MATRSSSTPYAILGMLSFAPMSGYDIRKEAASSIGYFWNESYGQIYPALRELAASGLAKRSGDRRTGHRDRHVYEITERGREALRRWRAGPPRATPARNELLLKLFFGERGSVEHDVGWIEQLIREESEALRRYRRIKLELMKEQRDHPSLPFWLITLSYGQHRSRAVLRWSRETLNALRAMEGGAARRGPAR